MPARTIAHHIQEAWNWQPASTRYFYCDDPACEIAYFGEDGSAISRFRLRTPGVKDASDAGTLCYCFGVSRGDVLRQPAIRQYVIQRTQTGDCACDVRNPSGRCCLKDFPRG